MTIAETLVEARANLLSNLLTWTVNPKPTYSIEGQSMSYGEFLKMLTEGITAINELLVKFDPFEFKSVME